MGKEREMDTNVLKTFIAVCEYSGFSAAAKELGYTQSTVSSQIKQLEKELDVRLFDRYYHKINLTEKGVLVLQQPKIRNIHILQYKFLTHLYPFLVPFPYFFQYFPIETQKRYFSYINDIFNNIQQNN